MSRIAAVVIAGAMLWSSNAAAQTPTPGPSPAEDAIGFFAAVCVPMMTGLPALPDDGRYRMAQVEEEVAKKLISSLDGAPLWHVQAPASGVQLMHYVTHSGICGVEIGEADREEVERRFDDLRQDLLHKLSASASEPDVEADAGGKSSIWRLRSADGDFDLGIETFPPPAVEPQQMLLLSRAHAHAQAPAPGPGAPPEE